MTQLNETTNRAEMQCSDVNPGAVQKGQTAPFQAGGVKHVN